MAGITKFNSIQTLSLSILIPEKTYYMNPLRIYSEWEHKTTWGNYENDPDSKVHGANMGPTWALSAPSGPHLGPMNLAIRGSTRVSTACGNYTNSLILDECKVLGHFQMHFLRIFILWFKWHRHLLSKVGSTSICNASASMMTKFTGTFRAVVKVVLPRWDNEDSYDIIRYFACITNFKQYGRACRYIGSI